MDDVIKEIGRISEILDTSKKMEQQIVGGPRGDFEQYGECLKQIGKAKKFLRTKGSSFKASPGLIKQLSKLEHIGQLKCDESLISLITKFSVPANPKQFLKDLQSEIQDVEPVKGKLPIKKDKLKEISKLSQALQLYPNGGFKWEKEYQNKRRGYVLHSLQKLQINQSLQDYIVDKKKKTYTIHPFVELYSFFIPLVEGENLLAKELFPKNWVHFFYFICEGAIDYIIESGEHMLKLYQNVTVFRRTQLLDIVTFLERLSPRLTSALEVPEAFRLVQFVDEFIKRTHSKIRYALNTVKESIESNTSPIRENGNVDQLTNNVLLFLSNIAEHQKIVSSILSPKEDEKSLNNYSVNVLYDLLCKIIQKAKDEKNITLKSIYGMNNIQFIVSKAKNSSLIIPETFYAKAEKELKHFNNTYATAYVFLI